jgi:L-amino acid N-acyltransferase YncA
VTFSITPMSLDNRKAVIDIFNYYIQNSFAAYPEKAVTYEFYETLLDMCHELPNGVIRNESGTVVGFGMLRPYNPISTFSTTAEITYFIKQGHTGFGLGTVLLEYLINEGINKDIKSILASVSSLNDGSMRFHKNHGFVECGRFRKIGRKQEQVFDVVYYQKML